MHGEWLRKPDNDTAVVFVHGILSSGEAGWRNDNGAYWPTLLRNDENVNDLGIYVYSYRTDIFSGNYHLGDVVDDLKERMKLDDALKNHRLIFVCHSMGGIVVRQYLVTRVLDLIAAKVHVGLFLLGSPSLGAGYANWLKSLAKFLGNSQAQVLRFAQDNAWLNDLDKNFKNLHAAGKLQLTGKELVEDNFIILKKFFRKQIVEPFSGARYFGEPYKVPHSDHFSIAKPESATAIHHRLLVQFIKEIQQSPLEYSSPAAPVNVALHAQRDITTRDVMGGNKNVDRSISTGDLTNVSGVAIGENARVTIIQLLEKGTGIQDLMQGVVELQKDLATLIKRNSLIDVSAEESIKSEASSNKEQLGEIKRLLDEGKIQTARQKALELKSEIEKKNVDEIESNFLLCTYVAESFIASPNEEKNAIPYLKQAHAMLPNEERGLRCLAAAHLFDNKPDEGLAAINKALELNPQKAEAINIKAHFLIDLGRNEEAAQLFTEENIAQATNPPHIHLAKAAAMRLMGRYDEAIQAAEKAIELSKLDEPDTLILLAEILLDKLGHSRNQNHGRLNLIEHQAEFEKASSVIEEAIKLLNPERKRRIGLLYVMRGSLHFWTGKYDLAETAFTEALHHEFENAEVLRNYALSLSMQGKYQEAVTNLFKAKESGCSEMEFIGLLVEIYLLSGNPDKAIQALEESLKSLAISENEKIELRASLTIAYDNDFKTHKADELLSALETQYTNHPNVLWAKGMHQKLLGQPDSALDSFNKALPFSSGYLNTQLKAAIADILYEKKAPEAMLQAAALYSEIADVHRCDNLLQRQVSAFYHSGQYLECLELCKRIGEIHGVVDFALEIEAAIFYKTNNFALASDLLKVLSTRHRGNPNYLVNYAFCLFRLGRKNEALDVVLQAEKIIGKKSDDLVFLSVAYETVGRLEKALELSHRALEEDPMSPEIHLHFIFLFIRAENSLSSVDEKFVRAYQNCVTAFKEKFPSQKEIEIFKVPEKPEEFRQQMLVRLQEFSRHRVDVETLYQQKRLPLVFLAKGVGRDVITTWGALTEHPYLKIWVSSGNANELAEENQCAQAAKSIVIDTFALLTMRALELLPKLTSAFDEIIVPQPIIDQIQLKIRFEKIAAEKGHWVISDDEEKIVLHHTPSEYVKKNIEVLESMLKWFNENPQKVKVVGKSLERTIGDEYQKFDQFESVLGAEFFEALLESRVRNIPLFAEDFRLRQLGRNDLNVKSFGTQSLLKVFLNRNLVSKIEYNQALITLLALNYHFISITSETIVQNLDINNFDPTKSRTLLPFEALKHPDNDLSRLINVATGFLMTLWNSNLHLQKKQQWTDVMLNSVISNRHGRITESILRIENGVPSDLIEFNNRDFKETIKTFKTAFGGSLI